jgi:hypothetical protein
VTKDLGFWLYLINATTLIIHEIDSAYWKEWELFRLPGGVAGFLLLHFPLLWLTLYGLVLVGRDTMGGNIISLVLSLAGIFAFSIHTCSMRQGREQFKTPVSLSILWGTLLTSLAQLGVTLAGLTAL